MQQNAPYVLILYYSRQGSTQALARQIALGVSQSGMEVRLRSIPSLTSDSSPAASSRDLSCTLEDVEQCQGLALGSPTRFGHMAAPVQHFLEQWSGLWQRGALIDKPAAVFTSSQSAHGGQEATLLGMMLPLLHQGMVILGIPYDQPALSNTLEGGGPYGAGHIARQQKSLCPSERQLAQHLGLRLGQWAQRSGTSREPA